MPHTLDGVSARLERAEQHILELQTAIRAFEEQHPCVMDTFLDPSDSKKFGFSITRFAEPPQALSVTAGVVLYLLRSSLDHVVGQLLIQTTPPAAVKRLLQNSSFLICRKDPADAKHIANHAPYAGTVPGISGEALDIIQRCQPCLGTHLPRADHPLAILDELCNHDKHRQLLQFGTLGEVTLITPGPSSSGMTLEILGPVVAGSSNAGTAQMVRGSIPTAGPVDVSFQSSAQVAFKEVGSGRAEPAIQLLERLVKHVRALVGNFRAQCPEFKG